MKGELIFGVNPVKESLQGLRPAFALYVQIKATDHRMDKILSLADDRAIPVYRREKLDLTKMCASSHHQGVVLDVEPFCYDNLDDILIRTAPQSTSLLLLLDGIQDPQNLGALIRTAACAGVDAVLIPKDRACGVTAAVERASAGAVETVPVAQITNTAQTLDAIKKAGYWVYALDADSSQSLYSVGFSARVAIVIGGEGEGVRHLVRKRCDEVMSIPHYGGVSSLNASVAGGIALFEAARAIMRLVTPNAGQAG